MLRPMRKLRRKSLNPTESEIAGAADKLMRRAETLATLKRNASSTPRTGFRPILSELIGAATESAAEPSIETALQVAQSK